MSSLSSSLNSMATVSVVDIYRRYLVRNKDDRHYLAASWLFGILSSIIMILGALILVNSQTHTLQDTGFAIASILAAGLIGIYLIGFFTKICDWRSISVGIACTVTFTIWAVMSQYQILPQWLRVPFDLYYTTIFGNIVMLLTATTAGIILGRKTRPDASLVYWSARKTAESLPPQR
jgi:SSS family solute:Na+ symporter